MNDKTSLLINRQVPDFVRSDYPKFLSFLEAYYKFLDSYSLANDRIAGVVNTIDDLPEIGIDGEGYFVKSEGEFYAWNGNIYLPKTYELKLEQVRDVDLTSDYFLYFLRQEFVNKFPKAQINDEKLIKIIRNVYSAKGTVNAIELLFRIFFNEAVTVKQPGKNILRASDGRWLFENSITLKRVYGTFDPASKIQLRVENSYGIFYIDVERVQEIDADYARFYYRNTSNIIFETDEENPNQRIDIIDQRLYNIDMIDGIIDDIEDIEQIIDIVENGLLLYRGKLIKSPSHLRIVTPGKAWRKGQVFFIKGTVKDTIARVTDVGPNGELLSTEIFEYGIGHAEDQLVIVSPYPQRPGGAVYDIVTTTLPSGFFNYVLTIEENTENLTEEVLATSSVLDSESYFASAVLVADLYCSEDYNGKTAFYQKSEISVGSTLTTLIDPELTVEEWYESRSLLVYEYDYNIAYRGEFLSDEGQISNPNIKLQDNYFYQLFSYVIETTRSVDEYRNALNLIHPAGLKFFGELSKTAIFVYQDYSEIDVLRSISKDTNYFNDLYDVFDTEPEKLFTKVADMDSVSTDETYEFNFTKISADSTSLSETYFFDMISNTLADSFTLTEAFYAGFLIDLIDATDALTDTASWNMTQVSVDDVYTDTAETYTFNINTVIPDAVSATHGTPSAVQTVYYDAGLAAGGSTNDDWSDGSYYVVEKVLSIP